MRDSTLLRRKLLLLVSVFFISGCSIGSSDVDLGESQAEFLRSLVREESGRRAEAEHVVPRSSEARYNFLRGELALSHGNLDDALEFYQEAAELEEQPSPFLRSRLAQMLVRRGELKEALEEVDLALNGNSDNVDLLELRAGILATLKENVAAIQVYERIIELTNPDHEEPYILIASLYAQEKDFAGAKAKLRELIDKKPESFFGYYYLARMSELSGEIKEAEGFYKKALEFNPNADSIQLELARLYGTQKRYSEAKELCEAILATDPNNVAARNLLGQLFLGENRVDEALREFEIVGSLEDDSHQTRFKIALIKLQQGDSEGAITDFNLVLASHSDNATALYYLASAYADIDKVDEAIEALLKIKAEQRYYLEGRILLAYLLRQQKRFPEAVEAIEEASEHKPDKVRLLVLLASLYHDVKQYADSVSVMEKVISLQPKRDRHHFILGVYYDENGQQKKAMESMNKAIELNSKNADALNYLGYTLAEREERLEEAEAFVRRALKVEEGNGYFIDSLGWVYYKMGRVEDALKELERAVALLPEDAVILEHYGVALLEIGQKEKALETLRKALLHAPGSDDEEAEVRIEALIKDVESR